MSTEMGDNPSSEASIALGKKLGVLRSRISSRENHVYPDESKNHGRNAIILAAMLTFSTLAGVLLSRPTRAEEESPTATGVLTELNQIPCSDIRKLSGGPSYDPELDQGVNDKGEPFYGPNFYNGEEVVTTTESLRAIAVRVSDSVFDVEFPDKHAVVGYSNTICGYISSDRTPEHGEATTRSNH